MLERLPEGARVALCNALKPLVFPVHAFVDRWYYTEPRMRLARISGTIMWWHFNDEESTRLDGRPYPTAEELLDELYGYADRSKPLPPFGQR